MEFLSVGLILTATSNATPRSWESTQPEPRKYVCIILYKGVYAMKLASALYINRTQLAEELGVSVATIRNWSSKKDFPTPVISEECSSNKTRDHKKITQKPTTMQRPANEMKIHLKKSLTSL